MANSNAHTSVFILVVAVGIGGCHMKSPERPERSAFNDAAPLEFRDSDPIGPSVALVLTRPKFTGVEIAKLARSMAEVVADQPLPPVESIPAEQLESFEKAAAAVENRVWLTMDAGDESLEFNYYPDKPAIMVGTIDRDRPTFSDAGVYPGIGRDRALERAHDCADLLVEDGVLSPQSYVRDPILERAPSHSYPLSPDASETIEVTDHYHFIFGQAPHGILLGNAELTIDVDAHSGQCFRMEVSFIDVREDEPVDLIVSIEQARAAVEGEVPPTGGNKVVDDGRVVYWLDPQVRTAVVEPRYVSSYVVVSEDGLASQGTNFAVSLSHAPPTVTEF